MRSVCAPALASASKIDGQARPSKDKFVHRKFGAVAKLLWEYPDAHIATIAKCDPRTGRRILRGEADVPVEVALEALAEMLRPLK